jgi:hypothetical protein
MSEQMHRWLMSMYIFSILKIPIVMIVAKAYYQLDFKADNVLHALKISQFQKKY